MSRSNAAYLFLLNDKTRGRVEARGQIELNDQNAEALGISKNWHTGLIVFVALFEVWLTGLVADQGVTLPAVWLPYVAFLIGGLVDAWVPIMGGTTLRDKAIRMCQAFGEWLFGFILHLAVYGIFLTAGVLA
eukprot:SAG22_NODE_207_length_15278_cov_4.056855_12_plen_132_part_00